MSNATLLQNLFSPRSVALIGGSGDPAKNTSRPQRYLRKYGYPGRIFPVNPGRDEILREKAYPAVTDVREPVDHAFIMVPKDRVAEALAQCIAKKIPVVTIYSDGFAETGAEGLRAQDELVGMARAGGVRLVGPNCIGIFSSQTHLALSVNAVLEHADIRPGPVSVVSQSGSMTGGLLSRGLGRGIGFSKVISVGNEADLGVGELSDLLVDDPHTHTILLFMETIRDAEHLARAGRRAYAAGKSMIVYKLGRSEAGQDLAASHTGALAGSDDVADAFFRANGILRVDMLETLFELPALVAKHKPSTRHRVAVMTTTGGGAAAVVDRLGSFGIDVVPPTERVIARLAARNIRINPARITDLTLAGAKKEIYGAVLDELLASDHCELVLAVAGSSAQFQPQIAVEPVVEADRRDKLLAVFLAPHAEASLGLLGDAGIAGFRTPESCAEAIRAWRDWRPPLDAPPADPNRLAAARKLLATSTTAQLNEQEACVLFAALGIPHATTAVIRSADQSPAIGYPVVAKVLSRDVAHKTDAGGVVLAIPDADALKDAIRKISRSVGEIHPQARIEGYLVQRMEKGLADVILGFKRDPQVGPVVVLGLGGVLAEIHNDCSMRLAPVAVDEAERMIDEVKGLAVIRGYRGLPRGDRRALSAAVAAFSQLAHLPGILEAEINPLIVKSDGVVAVDGLVIRSECKGNNQ